MAFVLAALTSRFAYFNNEPTNHGFPEVARETPGAREHAASLRGEETEEDRGRMDAEILLDDEYFLVPFPREATPPHPVLQEVERPPVVVRVDTAQTSARTISAPSVPIRPPTFSSSSSSSSKARKATECCCPRRIQQCYCLLYGPCKAKAG